jgi:hypothetical protein
MRGKGNWSMYDDMFGKFFVFTLLQFGFML